MAFRAYPGGIADAAWEEIGPSDTECLETRFKNTAFCGDEETVGWLRLGPKVDHCLDLAVFKVPKPHGRLIARPLGLACGTTAHRR